MVYKRYSAPFSDMARNFKPGDLIGGGWGGHAKGVILTSEPIDPAVNTWRLVWRSFEDNVEEEWRGPGVYVDRRMRDNSEFVIEEDPV